MKLKTSFRAYFAASAGVLLATTARAEPTKLSTEALDEVVAGNQQPNSDAETEGAHPAIVVADNARIERNATHHIVLAGEAQRELDAMNLANAAHADVATGLNVLRGASGDVRQQNQIQQTEIRLGGSAFIERPGAKREEAWQVNGASDSHTEASSFNEYVLRSAHHTQELSTYNANVPAYNPLQNLTVTIGTPKLPKVTVPEFGFDLTTTDDVGGVYGIRGHLGPFVFDPPQIVLGTVSLSGPDIVIRGGYVDLPSLDLGSAGIDFCVVSCGGVEVDLPTIDGPRIDFGAEFRIPNANPFKDVNVNAGGGFAMAGRGHVAVSLGHVTVGAEVSLDIPDLTTSFSFDVLGFSVNTGKFGVSIPAIDASINLIDSDIGVAYTADFEGALCVAIAATNCGTLEFQKHVEDSRVEVTHVTSSASESKHHIEDASASQSTVAGARMVGADADLIAMSEGSAHIDTGSTIELNANAQRGIKVFNAVNATGAMIGNAANVGSLGVSATSGALGQSNSFSQFQTRPRGR